MKASELRIGNLVYDTFNKLDEKEFKTTVLELDDFICMQNFINCKHKIPYKPIPLTEEFKIQFGNDKLVLVDKQGFVIFKNGYAYQFVFEDYSYIHSIQNLYFSLIRKELILQK